MSKRGVIEQEKPQQCDECGKIKELRPYGKNGAVICFDCYLNPHNSHTEEIVEGNFRKHVLGEH